MRMHKIFKKILKQNAIAFVLDVASGLCLAIMMAKASVQLSHLFDVLEVGDRGLANFKVAITTLAIYYAITIGLVILNGLLDARYICGMMNDLRSEMAQKLLHTSYDFFDKKNTGNFVSWFTNDANTLKQLSVEGFANAFNYFAMCASSFAGLCVLNPWMGFIALGFLALSVFIPQLFQGTLQREQEKVSQADETFTEKMRDVIQAFPLLLLTDNLRKFKSDTRTASEDREAVVKHSAYVTSGVNGVSTTVSLISQVGMIVVSVYLALQGKASFGSALAAAGLSGSLFNSILQFVQTLMGFNSAKPIYEKYEYEESASAKELDQLSTISFKQVDFQYEDTPILQDFTQTFDNRGRYALVGESGSGKTTILKLILGFIEPNQGEIDINGEPLQEVSRASLYKKVGYIDQNPILIQGSLRENMTFGRDVPDEEVIRALKAAGLAKFLDKRAEGLDSPIEEGGKNISGGEKERLAIARALLLGAEFLLVDEATSQLDPENAKAIDDLLFAQEDLGFIVVSHHFTEEALQRFDQVVRLS